MSEAGSRLAKTEGLAEGYASRVQGVFLVGDATEKVWNVVVGILHSRPPMSRRVVFQASSDGPGVVVGMKVACTVTGLCQAGIAEFTFEDRLKPSPITRGAHQTALTDEELVTGSCLVSAQDHGVAVYVDAEAMPNRGGSPRAGSPPEDLPTPIAGPIVHAGSGAQLHAERGVRSRLHLSKTRNREKKDSYRQRQLCIHIPSPFFRLVYAPKRLKKM